MPSTQRLINQVQKLVNKKLAADSTGHGYWHSYRVVNLALTIGRSHSANSLVLSLAGWLHDIAVPLGRAEHQLRGARIAKKILLDLNCPQNIINSVSSCILKHRYSHRYQLNTIEEKIISDADNLDALGATIIPRIFAYCGAHQISIYDPNIKPSRSHYLKTGRSTTGINHIYEKLFDLPTRLYTPTAKKLAQPRLKFLHTFLDQYLAEFEAKK